MGGIFAAAVEALGALFGGEAAGAAIGGEIAAGAGEAAVGAGAVGAGAGAVAEGVGGAALVGDATAIGYGGLDAASAATLGGGASVAGGAALGTGTAGALGAAGSSIIQTLGKGALNAGVSTAVGSLLAPKPATPPTVLPGGKTTTAPVPMPDPVAQQNATRKSLVEQVARRGRASTVLTSPGGGSGGKLGG
jgi:hypothetical protein